MSLIGISLALSVLLSTTTPPAQAFATTTQAPVVQSMPQAQSVQEYVESYFSDLPIMSAIAKCESRFHQYNSDGSVYRGEINNKDVGVMQINEYYQSATAEKLGLDIHTLQGNIAFGRYLFEQQGTAPWISSSSCWSKSKAAILLADAITK